MRRVSAAIKMLEAGLTKLPTEPNLEALLALARTESERQSQDQESLAAKEASERALMQAQATQRQAATLRKALEDRDGVDNLENLASQLRQMLMGSSSMRPSAGLSSQYSRKLEPASS